MSMCAFAKKPSLSNMQDDLKSLSNLSSSAYLNQKSRAVPPSLLFVLGIDNIWHF